MSGDRVRLESQERLDLEDARALQSLTYTYAQRMLADVLGAGSGCVSPFVYTYEDDGAEFWINLQPFAFYHSKGEHTRLESAGLGESPVSVSATWQGGIVTFDPTKQSAKVDYTTARNAARAYAAAHDGDTPLEGTVNALPWLWARPLWVDEDEDARRKWSMDLKTEIPVTINTRERQRVAFVLADAEPDADGGEPWVKIGKVTSWNYSADAPNHAAFSRISMWDSVDLLSWTKEPDGLFEAEDAGRTSAVGLLHSKNITGHAADAAADLAAYPGDDRDLGLIRVLYLMRNRLRRMGSKGTADPEGTPENGWLDVPKYSLRGLAKLLDDTVLPAVPALQTALSALNTALYDATPGNGRIYSIRALGFIQPNFAINGEGVQYLQSVTWWGKNIESVLPHPFDDVSEPGQGDPYRIGRYRIKVARAVFDTNSGFNSGNFIIQHDTQPGPGASMDGYITRTVVSAVGWGANGDASGENRIFNLDCYRLAMSLPGIIPIGDEGHHNPGTPVVPTPGAVWASHPLPVWFAIVAPYVARSNGTTTSVPQP